MNNEDLVLNLVCREENLVSGIYLYENDSLLDHNETVFIHWSLVFSEASISDFFSSHSFQ